MTAYKEIVTLYQFDWLILLSNRIPKQLGLHFNVENLALYTLTSACPPVSDVSVSDVSGSDVFGSDVFGSDVFVSDVSVPDVSVLSAE